MNEIPLVDLKAQYLSIKVEIDTAIQKVLDSTQFINGQEVKKFEEAFADYCDAKYAIGISSGTDALHLAFLALGVVPGDEVITVAHTFTASAEAIVHCGAVPVFVDIDPRTYTIDPARIEQAITAKTKVILPVHLYGQTADMDPINAIARKYGLHVVEDAAQAHGAKYKGQKTGNLGEIACFSFYPGKNLGAYGDAGAVVTNNEALAEHLRMLRDHGRQSKYEHEFVGYGNRLDTLQAAILLAKLPYLKEWTLKRRYLAQIYNEMLESSEVLPPFEAPEREHVYHLYVIRSSKRDELLACLKNNKIGAGIHYPVPLHLQKAYLEGNQGLSLPETERAAKEVLSLPLYPEMSVGAVEEVVRLVKQ
jgi:dTDP-4-amino-4,6-dideoxygalactose transaminase